MDFYTALSTFYDEIFAVSPADMAFINRLIPAGGRVLDIGCGTGNKTVLLHNAASVAAIDLDAGMIKYARTHHARPHIQYQQMDMRHISEQFATRRPADAPESTPFDTVLCLGNTLVHLPENELGPLFHAVRSVLRPNGSSVIQILHYDRLLDNAITQLPVIETPHTTFTRQYRWTDGAMHFCTSILLKATGERLENDIVLYPLRTETLERLLRAAGFRTIHWYGSFSGGPLTDDAFVAIAHCLM